MRFLIVVLIIYVFYRLIRGVFLMVLRPKPKTGDDTFDSMVQDPYCHTYIPQREAVKQTIDGTVYFFCSKTCQEKFLKERKKRE